MPFDFLKKGKPASAETPAAGKAPSRSDIPAVTAKGIAFDGLTEEWRLVGAMQLDGRLSDVLNRRESIPISDVSWAPIDGSEPFSPAPGLKAIDPYDLIVVLAGETTPAAADRRGEGRPPDPQDQLRRGPRGARRSGSSGPSTSSRAPSRSGCSTGRPRCSCR